MAAKLSCRNGALALLCNTLPTGAILAVLILAFGAISAAHFNSVISLVFACRRELTSRELGIQIAAQVADGVLSCDVRPAAMATVADDPHRPAAVVGGRPGDVRPDLHHSLLPAECARRHPYAVGLYITSAYWFTASTSFANPAVTIARSLTDTFAGIAPAGVIAFIVAQVVGGMAGLLLVCRLLLPPSPRQ
jgi:glycerol uptake facilitator-like aquaporin